MRADIIRLCNYHVIMSGYCQVIKLYAWEPSFENKITAIRDKEMDTVRKAWYFRAIQTFSATALPFVVWTPSRLHHIICAFIVLLNCLFYSRGLCMLKSNLNDSGNSSKPLHENK